MYYYHKKINIALKVLNFCSLPNKNLAIDFKWVDFLSAHNIMGKLLKNPTLRRDPQGSGKWQSNRHYLIVVSGGKGGF